MHKPLIRRLLVGCVAMMLLIVCSPVASASGSLDSGKPSKAEIQAMWQKVTSASVVFAEEPSVVAPYAAGKLTAEFLETGLTYTNYVRFVANLPLVQLNDTYNEDAQHGAVVLAANDTLTHYPDQPAGMDDAFYERACDATSSSNIFYCYGYSPQDTLKVAVGCFMDDDDSNNNDRLGHRRWVLNPKLKSIGFGYAQSQSGSNYAVMKVFDRSGDAVNYDYIAWPAAGNFPTNLFTTTVPWSITLNPSRYQTPDLSQLQIILTRKSDGTTYTFTESTGAPGSPTQAFLNVDTAGYGVSNCIIFNPGSSNISSYSGVYTVDVSGIYTSDGSAATLHYEVDFFDVNNVCTSHDYQTEETPATCTTPGSIVKTCRNCGESTTETTAALGHNYVDGTCTRCKEADPDYVAPDDGLSGTCGENLTWVFDEETGTLTISGTGDMDGYNNSDADTPWSYFADDILTIVVEEGVNSIGSYVFHHCTALTEVVLPDSLTLIEWGAFSHCSSLNNIEIPENVTVIDGSAFYSCVALTSISIPANVTYIDPDTFACCDNLSGIWVDEANETYANDTYGVLFNKDMTTLVKYPEGLSGAYTIPNGVTTIGMDAFMGSQNLTGLTIPDSVTEISNSAFMGCNLLKNIVIPSTITKIDSMAFAYCDSLESITFEGNAPSLSDIVFAETTTTAYYPANNPTWTSDVMQDYGGNITWVAYGNEVEFSGSCGENLTWTFNTENGKLSVSGSGDMYGADKLGWTAFAGDIRSVEIGNGATSVGAYAFSDCTNLADVQMPDTVMSIAYNAFENCSSLTAVDIPANVMEISYGAFMDCTGLASVELPQNVMAISYHAFDNCTSLAAVDFPASLSSIQDEAFGSCSGLDELRFTGSAPEMQSNAFLKVTADAYYPASNTTWTEAVRQNYGGTLTWIAEGGTVTPDNSCGENITWSFEEATGTLTISGTEPMTRSNGNSVMDDYARPEDAPWFKYQDQIITIIIEGTVDSIGKNAFAGCSNLTTVIIEEGVSEIDSTAFSDCDALENCYFEGSEEQWEDLGADIGEATVHTESAEPETHMETKTTVAPTCTEQGYDLYTCSCGTIRKDNFTDPTGHTWDEGTVTKQPTETENGIRTYTCTVCKDTKTEDIPYEAPATGPVRRIYGQDRIETALAVAAELKSVLKIDKFDAIILAAGGSGSDQTKFADALSGSYLATEKGAPILLYTKGNLSPKNLAFIEENLSDNGIIYLLGGNASIPEEVEEALVAEGYTTKRLGGANRYDTNLVILEEAGIDEAKEILISSGRAFADSLSASATGLPIMLVNGTNTALTDAQVQFLKSVKDKKITILGGTAAVSEALEAAIEEAVGTDVERIFGAARESTSAMIAEKYFADADTALIAYSKMYPDGLAGGVLANALHAPLLLTKAGSESIAREYIEESDISSGYVLGGTAVLTDETARAVFGLSNDVTIITK